MMHAFTRIALAFLLCGANALEGQPLQTDVPAHDPVIARHEGRYYLFATGQGIAVWSSSDRTSWRRERPVFDAPPNWAAKVVPTFKGHIWAPDISLHGGVYHLYYSVSAFGKNTSAIGLATNVTLDPADPRFRWVDRGLVLQSHPGSTNWNAIDPNLFTDQAGTPYLAFGSFWGGLKVARLAPDRARVAEDPDRLPTLASRRAGPASELAPADTADLGKRHNAIEAPFVFRRGGFYYLFASIDFCCKGPRSDYKMIVGRSAEPLGPYVDREGMRLDRGGGTVLLAGDSSWHGVGHNAVATFDGVDYLVFHGYDAKDTRGRAKLRIERLRWDGEGWPVVEPRKPE